MFFVILISKILSFLGRLIGRGSSLPGLIALKLCPDIAGRLKLPETVVAVTGSNGKTSTTELIKKAALAAGKRVVCNSEGSNQTEGVVTALLNASTLTGRVKADVVVLESDERFCQYTFKKLTPSHIAVLNLFRDQLTRNGHSDFVKGELLKGLPESSTLILNADEPVSASLSEGRSSPVIWFGVEKGAGCEDESVRHAYDDGAVCPVCRGAMSYDYRIYNHLGGFRCGECGFERQKPAHSITESRDGVYILDGAYPVEPQLDNPMFAYNIAAAFTVAVEAFGMSGEDAARAVTGHRLSNSFQARIADFSVGGHDGVFMLCKHENSIAYNGAIEAVCRDKSPEKTVIIAVDVLSRKYLANDMSWLWDIDFERLAREDVKAVYLCGRFADDLAVRFIAAGVGVDRLTVKRDIADAVNALREGARGRVFAMTCFTDSPKLLPRLRGEQ